MFSLPPRWMLLGLTVAAAPAHAADGMLATGFGVGGFGTRVVGLESSSQSLRQDDEPMDLVVMSDGGIVALGVVPQDENELNAQPGLGLLRLSASGALVTTFGGQGSGRLRFGFGLDGEYNALARTGDDQLYVAGGIGASGLVFRFSASGSAVQFPVGIGAGLTIPGQTIRLVDIVLLPDGRFVAAGRIGTGNSTDFLIARWNANGSLDTSFGALNGYTRVNFGLDAQSRDQPRRLLRRGNGGWLIGGTVSASGSDVGIAAFTAEGQVDTAFIGTLGTPGRTTFRFDAPTSNDELADLVELPSGRLLVYAAVDVAGSLTRSTAIGGLTASGFPDVGFAPQGRLFVIEPPGLGDEVPAALLLQPDGAVLLASSKYFDGAKTQADGIVRRLLPTGVFDGTFGNTAPFSFSAVQFAGGALAHRDEARAMAATDGAFFVLGRFSQNADDTEFGFAKLVNAAFAEATPGSGASGIFANGFE